MRIIPSYLVSRFRALQKRKKGLGILQDQTKVQSHRTAVQHFYVFPSSEVFTLLLVAFLHQEGSKTRSQAF